MAKYPDNSEIGRFNPEEVTIRQKTLTSQFDDNGREKRKRKWVYPKRDVTVHYEALTKANIATLYAFYMARSGSYEAFSFFLGLSQTYTGEYVNTGDGSTTAFDLPSRDATEYTVYVDNVEQSDPSEEESGTMNNLDIEDTAGIAELDGPIVELAPILPSVTLSGAGDDGIVITDDTDLDMGTGNFSHYGVYTLSSLAPAADVVLLQKHDGVDTGIIFSLLTTGKLRLTINDNNYDSTVTLAAAGFSAGTIGIGFSADLTTTVDTNGSVSFYDSDGELIGDAVEITPIASGTLTGLRISAVDGTAFLDNCSAITAYADNSHRVEIYDSAGKRLVGIAKEAGSGEAKGAEAIPDPTCATDFWNWKTNMTHDAINDEFDLTSSASCYESCVIAKTLYYAEIVITNYISGNLDIYNYDGTIRKSFGISGDGNFNQYFVQPPGERADRFYLLATSGSSFSLSNITIKPVTEPSTDGIIIVNAKGGATENWTTKESGFAFNEASYTYKVFTDSVDNAESLYVLGTDAAQEAAGVQMVTLYNRALDSDDVLALFTSGIDDDDKWGEQTTPTEGAVLALMPGGVGALSWADSSDNSLDASYPATGATISDGYIDGDHYIEITDPSGDEIIGTLAEMSGDTAIKIVSGYGSSTQNWRSKDTDFDYEAVVFSYTVYEYGDILFEAQEGADTADQVTFTAAPSDGARITFDFTGYLKLRARFAEDNMTYQTFYNRLVNAGLQIRGLLNDE